MPSRSSLTRLKRYLAEYRPQLEQAIAAIQTLEPPDAKKPSVKPWLTSTAGGFAYRFWHKAMTLVPTCPPNLILANYANYSESLQTQILSKVEAWERFGNLNAIALGLLRVLAVNARRFWV